MTARSLELIARADVILYDRLIPDGALDGARADAELIDVGKIGGGEQVPQEATNELLLEHARAGREVVRLKGGDPFVFGRGGEEAQLLRAAGHRLRGRAGRDRRRRRAGLRRDPGHAARRRGGGRVRHRPRGSRPSPRRRSTGRRSPRSPARSSSTWACAASTGSPRSSSPAGGRRASRSRSSSAARSPTSARSAGRSPTSPRARPQAGVRAPAITVVGRGRRRCTTSSRGSPPGRWPGAASPSRARAPRPARSPRGCAALGAQRRRGAGDPHRAARGDAARPRGLRPALRDEPQRRAAAARARCRDARDLRGPGDRRDRARARPTRCARAGSSPTSCRRARSPSRSSRRWPSGRVRRALIARAEQARDVLPDALRARGAEVEILALYRTVAEPLTTPRARAALGADYVTFTSASAVRFFLEAAGAPADGQRIVSIGPITSEALREHGLEPHVEAAEHTPDGLVAALLAARGALSVQPAARRTSGTSRSSCASASERASPSPSPSLAHPSRSRCSPAARRPRAGSAGPPRQPGSTHVTRTRLRPTSIVPQRAPPRSRRSSTACTRSAHCDEGCPS